FLILVLLVVLLAQLALFFTVRFSDVFDSYLVLHPAPQAMSAVDATTQAVTQPSPEKRAFRSDMLHYWLIAVADFLGVAGTIVLMLDLALMAGTMIVARVIGTAYATSAFIWSAVLLVLIFPWQAILNNVGYGETDFRVPGVLYTWNELVLYGKMAGPRDWM